MIIEVVGQVLTRRPRVMVVGDVILDEFKTGAFERFSSEAPVPIVSVEETVQMVGGAGNTAANIASLGGEVWLSSVIGDGFHGKELKKVLASLGISTNGLIIDQNRPTTKKTRVVMDGQQVVCLAEETRSPVSGWIAERVRENCVSSEADVTVISDYARGMVTQEVVTNVIATSRKVIADIRPRNFPLDCYTGAYLLTPNRGEAAGILGIDQGELDNGGTLKAARQLAERFSSNILITLDSDGMLLFEPDTGRITEIPSYATHVECVSGAGDTVVAAIAISLALGSDLPTACEIASRAAAIVVAQPGTTVITLDELQEALWRDTTSIAATA